MQFPLTALSKSTNSEAAILMKHNIYWLFGAIVLVGMLLNSCAYIPKNAKPIEGFNQGRYLGKWYEIARIDHRFEKNMNNVTAQYSLNENGTIKVFNSGYDYVEKENKSATGTAKFRGDTNTAALKVSFFGPFYSGYNVIAIDKDYKYALVAGESLDYLWILSRNPAIPDDVKQDYLKKATAIGYDTSRLLWVEHGKGSNPK